MRKPPDHRRKRISAPAGNRGAEKYDGKTRKIVSSNYTNPESPIATPVEGLISVNEACERSGETPATIINWAIRHKIGGHVKTGSGGAWMVDPDRLERLLAERERAS